MFIIDTGEHFLTPILLKWRLITKIDSIQILFTAHFTIFTWLFDSFSLRFEKLLRFEKNDHFCKVPSTWHFWSMVLLNVTFKRKLQLEKMALAS